MFNSFNLSVFSKTIHYHMDENVIIMTSSSDEIGDITEISLTLKF